MTLFTVIASHLMNEKRIDDLYYSDEWNGATIHQMTLFSVIVSHQMNEKANY